MRQTDAIDEPDWIFGYGSLVWRPAFPHVERVTARLHGWTRRFWQGSTDHRGRPGAPGRVVTLLPAQGAEVWGVAYRAESARRSDVLADLDVRERGGYERLRIEIEPAAGTRTEAVTWIATPSNPNYLGPAPLEEIADQVAISSGPSGRNAEYVVRLAEALRRIGAHDDHVFEVERALRERAPAPR